MFKFYLHAIRHSKSYGQLQRCIECCSFANSVTHDEHSYLIWVAGARAVEIKEGLQ